MHANSRPQLAPLSSSGESPFIDSNTGSEVQGTSKTTESILSQDDRRDSLSQKGDKKQDKKDKTSDEGDASSIYDESSHPAEENEEIISYVCK